MAERVPVLSVDCLSTGYGNLKVLTDVNMHVYEGEIVAVIGHNGGGKSTLLKAVFGLLPVWNGSVMYQGETLAPGKTKLRIEGGMVYMPQGCRVFRELTVRENLQLAGAHLPGRELAKRIRTALAASHDLQVSVNDLAWKLSGGQRQMLALAMALLPAPRLLLADEPTLGLAQPLVRGLLEKLNSLGAQGTTVLVVEQNIREVLRVAQRVYVMRNGLVSWTGSTQVLRDDEETLRAVYF